MADNTLYSNEADARVADLLNADLAGSELFYIDTGTTDANTTAAQIKAYAKAGLAVSDISGLGPFAVGTDAANLTGTIDNARLSAVPNSALANPGVTISGHAVALGGAITLAPVDAGLGNVSNDAQTKAAIVPNTTPGAGQILVGNAGATAYAPAALSGDGTLSAGGALTVTKSNGVSFGNAAFKNVGTTSGTVAAGDDARIIWRYATNADATGASGAATLAVGSIFETLGYASAGDGGGATWVVVSADPGNTLKLNLNGSGKFGKNIDAILRPEHFGCKYDGTIDQQQGFINLAAEINWRGGAQVEFPFGKDFHVFDTNPAANSYNPLMALSNLKGLRINFNGSRLLSGADWGSSTAAGVVLQFTDCQDVQITGLHYEQTFYKTLSDQYGMDVAYLLDECIDVRFEGMYVDGGRSGLAVDRSGSFSNSARARKIFMSGEFDNCYYPLNCRRNGDQVEASYKTHNVGRSYFPYNVKQHKIAVDSDQGGPFNDCLLKVYADSGEANQYNTLSQIDLTYLFRGTSSPSQSHIALEFGQETATSASGFIKDIRIKVDIEVGAGYVSPVLNAYKFDVNNAADNTTRNHDLRNVTVSGSAISFNDGTKVIDLFNASSWAGEHVNNLVFRDFYVSGTNAPSAINCEAIESGLIFENCSQAAGTGPWSFTNLGAGILDASRNVKLDTLKSSDTGYRRLPDGYLEQSGLVAAAANTTTLVNLPLAYRNTSYEIGCSIQTFGASEPMNIQASTASAININNRNTAATDVYWRTLGQI